MLFRYILNNGNQVKPDMWRKFVLGIFGPGSYDQIMKYYDCPCDDKNDPKCECWEVADKLLTDFTWYCNQRKFLNSYKKSKRPIYSWLLSQPEPKTGKAIHGIGQFFFFGNRFELGF